MQDMDLNQTLNQGVTYGRTDKGKTMYRSLRKEKRKVVQNNEQLGNIHLT